MTMALSALQRLAAGLEASNAPGTAVAPTRLVPHLTGSTYTEQEDRQRLEEARGVVAWVDDVLTRRSGTLELQQELDFDHVLLALLCGVQRVTPSGAGPYTYSFALGPTTPPDRGTATWEVIQSTGAADGDLVLRRLAHARPTELSLEWQDGGTTRLTTTWVGGAGTTPSARQAIHPAQLASRRVVPAAAWDVALDDTWATLGRTMATNVRALSWSLTTGLQPAYHFRGRETTLDLDGWYQGRVEGSLSLTLDLDAAAANEVTHWRDGDRRFVRLRAGNGLVGNATRSIRIDQAVRIIGSPDLLASDGEQATVELECELRSDAAGTADDFLALRLLSGLAGWAVTAPSVPRTVAAAAAGSTALAVTWTAPATGSPPSHYRVSWRTGSDPYVSSADIVGTSFTISGLVASTTYDVRVRAINAGGQSDWTTAVQAATEAP